ncbi:MAG: Ig-like domain-containing protein [Treponema sp.]|nr:Ig-like domain-containing protein [Treponema sp.]
MFKRNLFICILLVIFAGNLWAAGGRDANESRAAEDPSGFTDVIDTSEKKPGKYNYYLEAIDRAGNVTRSGPENIFIDPESDLPRTTIINPLPYMRVYGNMNIVGIAFDDDGIERVELAIYRGIDGKGEEVLRVTANGSDFWSYFLDTTDDEIWTDGDYTIKAWATDINGLSGISERFKPKQHKISTVYWRLDRKKPETIITSHEIGALVSGNIRLRGTVADGNGIAALSFSTDEGNKYTPVKFSLDKRSGLYNWEINLGTKQFDDGPKVVWFQARDGNGTIGSAAHLLFVNNTGPDVKVVYPEPNTVVSGLVPISVYAQHPVGLRTITWKAGNRSGEFEVLPGNHWYSTEVDLRGQKVSSIDVEIRATDVSGNVSTTRQRYRVDQVRDLPTVTLVEPVAGILTNPDGLVVRGTAADNNGVASVFYSLNGAPAVEIPCSGYFQFMLPVPPEGTHNLEVWAKDINGTVGNKVQVRGILVSNASIQPSVVSFTSVDGRNNVVTNFYTGMPIRVTPRMTMQIAFRASAAPVSASVAFGNSAPVPVRLTSARDLFTATVPMPEYAPDGITEIRLAATDRNGREFIFNEYVFVDSNLSQGFDDFPAPFRAADHSFRWVRPNELSDGRILIKAGEQLLGISTIPVRNAVLSGSGSNMFDIDIDHYGRVLLSAREDGEAGPLSLRLEVDSTNSFNSAQFRLISDNSGPTISMQGMTDYTWVRNNITANFNVSSRNRVNAVEMSVDMGATWQSVMSAADIANLRAPVNTNVSRQLDLTAAQDGLINVLIRARNESGLYSITSFPVLKDTAAPRVTVAMPIEEARVNGTIKIAFAVEEMGSLSTITYNRPARAGAASITREVFNTNQWFEDYDPRFFEVVMDSQDMPLDDNMRFTFTDKAGNSTDVASWDFVIAPEDDIPVVHIILPQENEIITSDFIVSGVMFDDDGIKNAQWRLNNGPWQVVEAENGFSIPIALSSLTDNEHFVEVMAEDIYGVRSQPVRRNFRVSLSEPSATMTYPLFDTVLKEGVELRGTAFDRNGIKDIKVSIDNGNTFNSVQGNFGTAAETVQWTYTFNTTILKDGPHVVFIRVWDRYDISATYANMINVDNTPPEIILDSPGDGSISVGNISVMGRILDPNLQEVSIELRSLDGITIPANLRQRRLEAISMVRENIDISGLPDGQYNIAIIANDRAGNMTRISRNVQMARQTYRNYIEVLYPLENEETSGEFILYGFAGGSAPAGTVTLRINGRDSEVIEVDDNGYFAFKLDGEMLNTGNNAIVIHSNFGGPTNVLSKSHNLIYREGGPWVTIDSFTFADFAYDRPYLYGRTGYILTEEDRELLADRRLDKFLRDRILAKTPDVTEISFDNGRTFRPTERSRAKGQDYRFRLETGDMPEGFHYIVVRTTMKNGEYAVTRMLVQVDKTHPVIRLISPEPGGLYNKAIAYSASATDDNELVSLTYHLRVGDKAAYEVPGFLQGLYLEGIIPPFLRQIAVSNEFEKFVPTFFAGGATYTDFGLGLSFFDDNVKIQGQYGFLQQKHYESLGGQGDLRYGGHVIGLKLLANVYALPFASFMGPDFEWLSASIALGANFSNFSEAQSGSNTWMSALLAQIEFPKVQIPKREFLRTFSLFTEIQLWFVPTDVDAAKNDIPVVIPHVILGLRVYIF